LLALFLRDVGILRYLFLHLFFGQVVVFAESARVDSGFGYAMRHQEALGATLNLRISFSCSISMGDNKLRFSFS
jgi:hypothetical protein